MVVGEDSKNHVKEQRRQVNNALFVATVAWSMINALNRHISQCVFR